MTVFAPRACAILHDLIQGDDRPFLIPANICPVVPETFQKAGRAVELVDIQKDSLEIDPEACLDRLPAGGLLFVRPYGRDRDVDSFFRKLKEMQPDLLLIDDKCLCRPDCEGLGISQWADATLFSTGYAKHVDLGYGGFAHLKDGKETPWEEHRRRTEEELPRADEHKARLNAIYSALPPEIQLPPEFQGWRFNLRVPEPDRLVESLFAAGLFASRHYPSLSKGHPVAERLHGEIVNLFNDRYFDEERAERAVSVVLRHLAG